MKSAPLPNDEPARLAALRSYGVLDTTREAEFDDLVALAAHICGTPIALISLIDERRQWFKAAFGLDVRETSREISFCSHAVHRRELYVVTDAASDTEFADNPLVTGELGIRFYAGAPLFSADGHALGALCVLDRQVRRLTPEQMQALTVLSRHVMAQMELRRQAHERARINRSLLSLLEDERLAQTSARETEALNRAVLNSVLTQIAVLDRGGKILTVNDVWRRYLQENAGADGRLPGAAEVGNSYLSAWRQAGERGDAAAKKFAAGLTAVLDGEAESFTFEYASPSELDKRWFLLTATPLNTAAGGAAVAHLDITERKILEEQVRQSSRLEAIGQLTGGVAHDFNNLLTVIFGNAELLREQLPEEPLAQELADMILGAARSAAELTRGLLAFARKQTLNPVPVDGNRLLAALNPLLSRTLGEHIRIEIVKEERLWHAIVDPTQLESALLNLCINSRDAMPDGGRLVIETANVRLDEEYAQRQVDVKAGEYVLIAVADSGVGIPAQILGLVFEPFFTTKETGKGTGLGLPMVYGFVKQSGGHIAIYSEVGHGTTVRMYFPRMIGPADTVTPSTTGRFKIIRGSESILLVEDDEQVRRLALGHLKALGYQVLQARNGLQALDMLRQPVHVDLLFTDVVMPGGMSGRQLADAALQLRPELKVLFTSGYSEDAIMHHGRLDPGVHLLAKPYRRSDLARRVRALLDGG